MSARPPDPRNNEASELLVADTRGTERWGAAVLVLGLAGTITWAALAPLDEGVPAQGTVMVDTKRKTVQHLTGGIIDQVFVREAQVVKAGTPLIKLNDTHAKANYEAARQRYISQRATEDRLTAEQLNEKDIRFHPDVLAVKEDPVIAQHIHAQTRLMQSRRQALETELAALGESARGQSDAAKGLNEQLTYRHQQLTLVQKEKENIRGLVQDNYAPETKLLELERMEAEIRAGNGDVQANLARARRGSAEMSLRRTQKLDEFRREIDAQMADVRREIAADAERFRAASEELERTVIRAPAGGTVTGFGMQNVGGIIPPGGRIMDIVPLAEDLTLEARVEPHLIDRLKPGQFADIRFNNFAKTPQLVVRGELLSLSADLLNDPNTGAGFYLARVRLTPEGLKTLGDRHLQPGMPAEIIIKTGERSLLNYIAGPLFRRIAQGLKEQ